MNWQTSYDAFYEAALFGRPHTVVVFIGGRWEPIR